MKRRGISSPAPSATVRAALIVLIGAAIYLNALSAPFVFDDEASVVENTAIRSLSGAFAQRIDSPLAGRPVVALSFAFNFALAGLDVTAFRVTNVAIHIACALLLFGIARRTLRQTTPALAIALIWVVHPLNSEAVDYVTQGTESLMAFFLLLTLYSSLRAHLSARSLGWQLLAIASCAAGMGCKESMVVAPVVVFLYDRVFLFDSFKAAMASRWRLYGSLALTWLFLLYLILPGPRASSSGFNTNVSPWTYLLNQCVMITRYVRLVFWPSGLVTLYGPPRVLSVGDVWPQALFVVSLLIATFVALWKRPPAGFLGAFMFLCLAPTSSIVPIVTEVGAERRMYLASMALIALSACAGFAVSQSRQTTKLFWIATAAAIVSLSVTTIVRNDEYQSALMLAQTSLDRWPTDVARGGVGGELLRLGRDDEALPLLRQAARTDPRSRYNLGVALFNNKRFEETIQELGVLIAEHPNREEVPWARRIRGHSYIMLRRWRDAYGELRVALSMMPWDKETKTLMVDALNSQGVEAGTAGKHAEAIGIFRRALEFDPASASVRHNLATTMLDSGDIEGALAEGRKNIADHPADAPSYNLVGRALATEGKLADALPQLEQAVKLEPSNQQFQEDLQRVQAASKSRR